MNLQQEYDEAVRLLGPLDRQPDSLSTVDIRRAMAIGRQRRRTRKLAGYGATAAVTALALVGTSVAVAELRAGPNDAAQSSLASASATPPSTVPPSAAPTASRASVPAPAPPTKCQVHRLPIPDGVPMALVTGADPTGRYLLGRSYPRVSDGFRQAILWDNGRPSKIPLGGDDGVMHDVNTSGVAVGTTFEGIGGPEGSVGSVPYVWRDGRLSRLAGVRFGSANAISPDNVIVGSDDVTNKPVLWRTPDSQATPLPLPELTAQARAHDIDDDGTIVGTVGSGAGGRERPYLWLPDGTHRELPIPAEYGDALGRAFAIRNGYATGLIQTVSAQSKSPSGKRSGPDSIIPARWNVQTGEVQTYRNLSIRPGPANVHGWLIGTDDQGRAVLIADGKTIILPDLELHRSGELTNIPTTLSDDGRTIGGQSDDRNQVIRAVVWRCS